jgi:hypothetical protein
MKLVHKNDYRLYKAGDARFPHETYILCCDAASDILYNPQMAGKRLQDRMEKVAEAFVDAAGDLALDGKTLSQITEVVFLSGGLFYQLNHGFKKRYGQALPQCFLGIKRQRVEGSEGGFTAVSTYENFESLPDKATVIIGDTIATGATLQKGIQYVLDGFAERGYSIENLVVCSLACSTDGAMILKGIESRMQRDFPGAKAILIVAEEFFHLMPDGTDLRFLYPDAVMPDETRKRIADRYGEYLGKEMKCAVFDWGTRCKNPIAHYREFLSFAKDMKGRKLDAKSRGIIDRMEKEAERTLAELKRPLR